MNIKASDMPVLTIQAFDNTSEVAAGETAGVSVRAQPPPFI